MVFSNKTEVVVIVRTVHLTMTAADEVRFETPSKGAKDADAISDRRPSTPHPNPNPSAKDHDFDNDDIDGQSELNDESTHHDSCIGISLHTVMSTLKGEKEESMPDSDNRRGFFPSIKAMVQKTLSPVNWSGSRKVPRAPEDDTFDDYGLINRLPSWKTLESPSYHSRSQMHGNPKKPSTSSKQVQFQYPPITSIRLRPRTESDEIDRLYYAPEELDQIEDDRSDTKAADDIETLCVIGSTSDDMDSVPGVVESMSSPATSLDSNGFSFISRRSKSTSISPSSDGSGGRKKKKGIVRGVQILLREKSIG